MRRLWLKRRPIVHRWFGDQIRDNPAWMFGMTFSERYRGRYENKKRRNPFIKRPWPLAKLDRHGRPKTHPLFGRESRLLQSN